MPRLFPKDVNVGDEVCVRRDERHGGWFTDAGTVDRGRYGRAWLRVVEVKLGSDSPLGGQWPMVMVDDAPLAEEPDRKLGSWNVAGAANSKLLVRRGQRLPEVDVG